MQSRTVLCIPIHGQRESLCFDPIKCALWHPQCSLYYPMITGPVDGAAMIILAMTDILQTDKGLCRAG